MKFFMKEENVNQYIEMTKEYDPTSIVNKVKKYLPKGSTLLELGMGEGRDLELLSKEYKVVGSDNSEVFINKYKKKNKGIEVLPIDATMMNTERKFDCIYSNKVLHHLTKKDFIKSLKLQKNNLNNKGIIFMTLWNGEYREEIMFDGEIRFTYYLENDIREIVKNDYDIVTIETYNEFEEHENDSLLVILRKR
ncbi:class I SAM-dependent methyltransferase [Clostridium sp. UBA7503]|uniref:class I SAM-dependent methyltransferase n=1 Tax=Clostridium sp. UBA7503 TaxID=1946377 RepID=UPI003216A529